MKKFYVIGNKVSQSLSPLIFNYWFKKYKINAKYFYLELTEKNFDKNINELLNKKETTGLNITIPFKKKIIKHLYSLDSHSSEINAVNCVYYKNKKQHGKNTDWQGYYNSLPKMKTLKEKKILLIGYGGAAHAIHYVLARKGVKNIIILNRTKKKIRYQKTTRYTISLNKIEKYVGDADIIINTTPKNPINTKVSKLINKDVLLSDIVYIPKITNFLKRFRKNRKVYGIQMLLNQFN